MYQYAYNLVNNYYHKHHNYQNSNIIFIGENGHVISTDSNSNVHFSKHFLKNFTNNSDNIRIDTPSFFRNGDGNNNNAVAIITDKKTGNIYGLDEPINVAISDGIFDIILSVPGATKRVVYNIYLLDLSGIDIDNTVRASPPLNDSYIFINPGKEVKLTLDEIYEGTTYLITEISPLTYNDNYIYFANRTVVNITTEIKDATTGITYILVDNIPESIPAELEKEFIIKINPPIDSTAITCFNIYPENTENDPIRSDPLNKTIIKLFPNKPVTLVFPDIKPKSFYGIYSVDCD